MDWNLYISVLCGSGMWRWLVFRRFTWRSRAGHEDGAESGDRGQRGGNQAR